MSSNKLNIALLVIAAVFLIVSQSLFQVDEREQALVLQLGQPVGEPRGPGLHLKIPLVQEVKTFDRRILSVDPKPEQVVIASSSVIPDKRENIVDTTEGEEGVDDVASAVDENEIESFANVSGEPIIVDGFARYKIVDPLQFLKTLGTINIANSRLENILNDAMRSVLGQTSLQELLSDRRTSIMDEISRRVNSKTKQDELGIEIVDIRIVRADLTRELRTSTVRRMISELQERATETRAKGEERAKEIRSTADKERVVILANSERQAQIIRGEGDKLAIKTYTDAFNKDKEFYGFIRSMEAYKTTLSDEDTRLILSPNSDFFKYFQKGR